MTRDKRNRFWPLAWPHPRPEWQPLPKPTPGANPQSPGRHKFEIPLVIVSTEGEDSSKIEVELAKMSGGGKPPPPPTQITPTYPSIPDDCSWYISFRYFNQFGIYIREECLLRIIDALMNKGMATQKATTVAYEFYYRREYFHYQIDRAVELEENVLATATGITSDLWLQRWKSRRHKQLDKLERALANYHGMKAALQTLKSGNVPRDREITNSVFVDMLDKSGSGYKDVKNVANPFTALAIDELLSEYLLLNPKGAGHSLGPVHKIAQLIPRAIKKGNLGIDPSVPVHFV